MSDYSAQALLAWLAGKTAMPTLPTVYLALFTAVGVDAGTGFTEVTGGAYARVATTGDWAAASGSAPSTIANNATVTFATPTANWGTVIGFGLYDAATAGNLLAWDYLGNYPWMPATVSSASPGSLTAHAHGYSVADNVVFSTEFGGTAPTFSLSNFTGLLAVAHAATDTFDVTNAATAVNTSATGNGMVRKVASQVISTNVVASFASGALTLSAA
ncbi:MAG TPA: hypothetical protein DEQ40_00485 [Oxalobacteraceae bacterium]|nr:hypothetical protein [Oxalobacteraceae bacterium]